MKKIFLTILVIIGSLTAKCEFLWGIFNQNTRLEITVVDGNGTRVKGAKICLYNTKEDYIKEINPIVEAIYSNEEGFAKFEKLEAKKYFIVARKEKMDNSAKNPIISKLKKGKLNKIIIVIQ